jgi:hypothetical protein
MSSGVCTVPVGKASACCSMPARGTLMGDVAVFAVVMLSDVIGPRRVEWEVA